MYPAKQIYVRHYFTLGIIYHLVYGLVQSLVVICVYSPKQYFKFSCENSLLYQLLHQRSRVWPFLRKQIQLRLL